MAKYTEEQTEKSFWGRVNKETGTDCWLWTAGTKGREPLKYGSMWVKGKSDLAHRYSYILHKGDIPHGGDVRGMCVMHTCDTPLCVNPAHLVLGTHTDNMQDKLSKKRCGQANKTHCPSGHEYNEVNTYTTKKGLRMCRVCHKLRERKRRAASTLNKGAV